MNIVVIYFNPLKKFLSKCIFLNNYKAGKEKKEEDQLLNYSSSQLTFFSKSRFVPTKQHLFFQDNGAFRHTTMGRRVVFT